MKYISISLYSLLVLVSLVCYTEAFNFKSMLFGEDEVEQPSATFGRPISIASQSKRQDIPCKNYICEDTNVCVKKPLDCPCKTTEKKCKLGDWYFCISSLESCDKFK